MVSIINIRLKMGREKYNCDGCGNEFDLEYKIVKGEQVWNPKHIAKVDGDVRIYCSKACMRKYR